jgi:TonB family protein
MHAHRTFQLLALTLALVSASPLAQSPGQIYDPGNGVSLPVVVTQVKAEYTAAAMKARIEGTVVLQSVVLEDGTVGDVRVQQSLDTEHGLDEQAVATMKLWKFKPGQRDGKPVAVRIYCEMRFALR